MVLWKGGILMNETLEVYLNLDMDNEQENEEASSCNCSG